MKGLLPRVTVHEEIVGADAENDEHAEKVENREEVFFTWLQARDELQVRASAAAGLCEGRHHTSMQARQACESKTAYRS